MVVSCLSSFVRPFQFGLGLLRAAVHRLDTPHVATHHLTFPTKASAEEFLDWLEAHGCRERELSGYSQGWIVKYRR
jgi:hypothetical protein